MNKEHQSESNEPMNLNLEVRLLTMLAGEASDFERDQLEQLIEQRGDVAETYARLREIHSCLVEVGTGELKSLEGEWKLPPARRESLLSVLSGEVVADDDSQPVFVAAKEQAKWSTLRLSKSFIAVASLLLVVGLAWGLSLPAVQMARKSARRVTESAAMRTESATDAPKMSGGTAMEFAGETEPPSDALHRYFADGDFKAPSVALDTAKSQLQETLQAGLPEPYYLKDDVQYFLGEANGANVSGSFREQGSARGSASYGGAGGYGGEGVVADLQNEMVAPEEAAVPFSVFGGAAEPDSPSDAPVSDLAAANPSNYMWLSVDTPELPALGLQVEAESLSRNEIMATPRIIVTEEKPSRFGESVLAIENQSAIEQKAESGVAPEPMGEEREYSFGIPPTNRGRSSGVTRGQVAAAAPASKSEGFAGSGYAMSDESLKERELAEKGLAQEEETRLARRGVELRLAEAEGLDELSAAQNAFSTFSLHVSDVSFKLAAAALSQGEWPDASKIRIEEFVNAFDYRDPLPTQAEKVACRMEQAIHPFLMQRNLLRISMRTAATGRSGGTPLRLTLLLDNSGSMERDDRRQTLQRAFEALIQQLTPADQITLISFANRPRLLADRVTGDQASQLLELIETLPSEGGTNIEAALQLAMEKANEQRDPAAQHRIIMLTDGAVNLGNADPEKLSSMVTNMRDAGIAFDAAGISARDLNDEVLEALTRQGDGRYYLLDSAEAVSHGFAEQIAGALRPSAKNVKVQIEFNPQRVGQYKLLGFEKHRLQQEDFRNDQVDAAEMTAAEAGVAVYQFEARPDGVGDIGSASVRFRDLSTGQMVERTWPIPYESHPPRIEEANPSLRIAAAAALFAAKLKSEPLGASVSLKALASWLAELPVADRNTSRVQQLQSMIEQARQIRGSEE